MSAPLDWAEVLEIVLLYPGWLRLAVKRRNPSYFAFAFFQALFELQTTAGFIGHLTSERRLRPRPRSDATAT